MLIGLLYGLLPGVIFGLIGAGSGILAVLLLSSFMKMPIHFALPLALLLTFIASLYTVSKNIRLVDVPLSGLVVVVLSAVIMAPVGVYVSQYITAPALKIIFNVFVVFATVSMWPRKYRGNKSVVHLTKIKYIILSLTGGFAGLMNSLLGVSGGVIVVPALNAIGFHIKKAIIVSSYVVLVTTMVSLVSYFITRTEIVEFFLNERWFVVYLASGCVVGSAIGHKLSTFVSSILLKQIFAITVGCVAVFSIVKSIIS